MDSLYIADILDTSLVNGLGIRTTIFCTLCLHNCKGCHNKELQRLESGTLTKIDEIIARIEKNKGITRKKVTFSGGDPFFQAEGFSILAKKLKKLGYNIWCYTGFTLEEILNSNDKHMLNLLDNIDTLVDGRFEENLKENAPKYTGSSNQRIINKNDFYTRKASII